MNLKKINNPFGGLTFYNETTTSTMSDAASIIKDNNSDGSLFVADYQTDGKGRIPNRKWLSEEKKNLTFTLALSRDFIGHGFGTIPLRAGLALSKTVKELSGYECEVKWPNDVVVNGKKISGILCQTIREYVLIGVGLNVNQLVFEETIKNKVTSLSLLTKNGFNLEMVLSKFLNNFYEVLKNDNWLENLNSVLYNKNNQVQFAVGNPSNNNIISGELVGLDDQGKVLIKDNQGKINSYLSGEFIL